MIQKVKETGDLNYNCKNKLDKVCFAQNAAYANSKNFVKRTMSDKLLKDRFYEISINPKYNGCQKGLASMVYKPFEKKNRITREMLAQELAKPVIKKLKRRNVHATYKDNIWTVDSTEMRSLPS